MSFDINQTLQTLSVFYFLFTILLRVFIAIPILLYLLTTRFYWIVLLYLAWYAYDHETPFRGGRKNRYLANLFGYYFGRYFPVQLVKTTELPSNRNYIFGCHPHGIGSFSFAGTFISDENGFTEAYPGLNIRLITLRFFFYLPVHREYFLLFGTCPASKESIEHILSSKPNSGNGVAIVIGGAREVHYTFPKTMNLILKNRKGFVRMALRHGASLVPVISFGENDVYDIYPEKPSETYRNFQEKIYELTGALFPFYNGSGFFQHAYGLLPKRKPLNVVVGKPIEVEKIETPEPTPEQLDQLHQRYIDELTELYYEHRERFGYGDVPLVLV